MPEPARLSVFVEGIGLLGPGLDGWAASAQMMRNGAPYHPRPTVLPVPEGLPAAERRRVGGVVKLALGVGMQATSAAGVNPATLPAVFSSSGGDGQNCHEICQTLASDDRQLSPTRFHNSVHNAAAGYWSIATGSKEASNALCAFDAGFSAGLLEAVTQSVVDRTPLLLVAYDAQYPPPLYMKRPIADAFGVAFVLSPQRRQAAIARITVTLADEPEIPMRDAQFESMRLTIPAARCLPLLEGLARPGPSRAVLEYLDGRGLAVEIEPCD